MSLPEDIRRDVSQLLWAIHDGVATEQEVQRFEQFGHEHPEIRNMYARFTVMCGLLHWEDGEQDVKTRTDDLTAGTHRNALPTSLPNIVIDLERHHGAQPTNWMVPGGMLFSYAASALIVVVGLIIGWRYHLSAPQPADQPAIAQNNKLGNLPSEASMTFVGRITGMIDCQWLGPQNQGTEGASVRLGQKLELAAGLLEIAYDSGAKVILQGPCSYKIDSRQSGYLAVGKVTACVHVASKGSADAHARSNPAPDSNATAPAASPAPLFAVRTPTALVTDLGTEFAIEVDSEGNSQTHVFQGSVEVCRMRGDHQTDSSLSLRANQSARVDAGSRRPVLVIADDSVKSRFPRAMPKRARLELFNTGIGLKNGDRDPHWQLVARSDEPRFEPHATYVVKPPLFTLPGDPNNIIRTAHLANEANHSQWLSLAADGGDQPGSAVYTYQTTFDLNGFLPRTAVLRGRFMVDNHVQAIRLNGHEIPVPEHPHSSPFSTWYTFLATSGFAEGRNVLEFDVTNRELEDPPDTKSATMFRIELNGSAVRQWQTSAPPTELSHSQQQPSEGRKKGN